MARKNKQTLRGFINKSTGITSNVNGARGVFRVNAGKSVAGTSTRFGDRNAKRRDLRRAFGLAAG